VTINRFGDETDGGECQREELGTNDKLLEDLPTRVGQAELCDQQLFSQLANYDYKVGKQFFCNAVGPEYLCRLRQLAQE